MVFVTSTSFAFLSSAACAMKESNHAFNTLATYWGSLPEKSTPMKLLLSRRFSVVDLLMPSDASASEETPNLTLRAGLGRPAGGSHRHPMLRPIESPTAPRWIMEPLIVVSVYRVPRGSTVRMNWPGV